MTIRANRTLEDRARFGLGVDTQDDNTDPATDETPLTAEGVLEATATDWLTAGDIVNTPSGSVAATNIQSAINELATDYIAADVVVTAAFAAADAAAEVINASYRPIYSALTSDSANVNASVTLIDSGLSVTLGVGTYVWDALVKVTTADAADVRFKVVAGTATVTDATSFTALVAPAAATVGNPEFVAWNTETTVVTGLNAAGAYLLRGTLVTTVGGTVKLQFAQGTSDATNTHIDSGSNFVARRVA